MSLHHAVVLALKYMTSYLSGGEKAVYFRPLAWILPATTPASRGGGGRPRSVYIYNSLFSWGWWGSSVHAGQHAHWRGAGSANRGHLLTLFYTICILVGQPWMCDFLFTGRSTLSVQFCIYWSVNPECGILYLLVGQPWVWDFVFTARSTLSAVRFCIYWSVNTECAIFYFLVGKPWMCDFGFFNPECAVLYIVHIDYLRNSSASSFFHPFRHNY